MHIQMSSFLLASFALLFCISSLEKSFAFQATKESNNLRQYHFVHLNSLFPSSSCSSSAKGPKRKASLEVVHKHGPCSQLNHNGKAKTTISPTDIMNLDNERVKYIHSRLSKNLGRENSVKELDSTTLPAKSGSLIGSANYFVVVGLGTPKRDLSLIFDTGSDLTWTQCEPCAGSCYKQQDAIFDPSKSSSYINITCTSSLCTQLTSAGIKSVCSSSTNACIYGIQYGDNSTSVGFLSQERLTITATDIVDDFLFGCGQDNEGLFSVPLWLGTAGLMGLSRHPISFVQQTSSIYNKIFSYCLPSTSSSLGHLTFGASAATNANLKYTPLSTISGDNTFYGLDIVGISVGGTKLPAVSSSTFSAGGSIIDSGTVITRLAPTVSFRQGMEKYPVANEDGLFDTCYDFSGYKEISVPKIDFEFAGGVTVELPLVGIFYVVSAQQVCLAFAANGNENDITIFGNVQQKTLEVVYDVEGGRIGFGAAECN
ncbi:Aspartic proteinase nepenthesin-1 [Glycine soja]|nr:Aspartic proteinase nepenthesin-1 [Glycine soja]